jgi:cobalt/nickel transport system permease protein
MLLSPALMHIPDGFLSVIVSAILWLVSILGVGYALRRTSRDSDERQVPMMGVLAAAIFAGQMLNFTVIGGSSGHLMGAAIATVLVGPWASVLVLTCVLAVQALIFQDGGLLVLGANIFNIGIVGVAVSYMAYRSVQRLSGGRRWGVYAGGFIAGWLSVEISALAVGLQLALSGTSPANIAIPAMGGIHALIGIGEGMITLGALAFLYANRPSLVVGGSGQTHISKLAWGVGLLLALGVAVLSPLASLNPDGLEWVAEQKGFLNIARGPLYRLIPDYVFPSVSNQATATVLAGILGTLLVFGVVLGAALLRRTRGVSGN